MKHLKYIFAFSLLFANVTFGGKQIAGSLVEIKVILPDVQLNTSISNNTVRLSWRASQQTKVRRYELEKSSDGENFFYITSFAGSEKLYTTVDKNFFTGIAYYRLKIIDAEGKVLYTKTEDINTRKKGEAIHILPTVLDANKLHIWVPVNTSISCAAISGVDGRLHRKAVINEGTNLAYVDITGITAGVYKLTVQTNKGETLQLKFTRS